MSAGVKAVRPASDPYTVRQAVSPALTVTLLLLGLVIGLTVWTEIGWAVPMLNDPKGFQNIPWGSPLARRDDMELLRAGAHITEYRLKTGEATFAGAEMTSILYVAFDDQFARVTIRYEGESVHRQVLHFLESQYGTLQRIPGQMTRGLNQQYTWRGPDTEISLTYQAATQRGFLFIDSRTLAPRFNDDLTDSAE
ncbi:MAG: hypothetical protein NZM29_06180 [Nitrospira sp.]|nr:hypothetical protein [Nitrospira sp.]